MPLMEPGQLHLPKMPAQPRVQPVCGSPPGDAVPDIEPMGRALSRAMFGEPGSPQPQTVLTPVGQTQYDEHRERC